MIITPTTDALGRSLVLSKQGSARAGSKKDAVKAPLEILDIWRVLLDLHDTQTAWRNALSELKDHLEDSPACQVALQLLARLPWGGPLQGVRTATAVTSLISGSAILRAVEWEFA